MLVATLQTNPVFARVKDNVESAIALMESAPAELYVLPELSTTGYVFADRKEVETLAEPTDGPSIRALGAFAQRMGVYVVAGFAERADRIYNSSVLLGPDGVVGVYRKVHLFDRENLFFAPGDGGFPVFKTRFGILGMMICFDWFFPESARSLALQGADIIAHPSNLVLPYCPDAMVTRCLENRVFAVTSNRVGEETNGGITLKFIGQSEIVRPDGVIVKRLNNYSTAIAVGDIDITQARRKSLNAFNDLIKGRRPDMYHLGDPNG
jgi:predicted amidohydrolase